MSVVSTFDCFKTRKYRWIYLLIFIGLLGFLGIFLGISLTRPMTYQSNLVIYRAGLASSSDPYSHYENASNSFPASSYLVPSETSYYILLQIDCSNLLVNQSRLIDSQVNNILLTLHYHTDIATDQVGLLYITSGWMPSVVTYNDLTLTFETWFTVKAGQTSIDISISPDKLALIESQQLYLAITVLMPSELNSIVIEPLQSNSEYSVTGYDISFWLSSVTWSVVGSGIIIAAVFIVQSISAHRTYTECVEVYNIVSPAESLQQK